MAYILTAEDKDFFLGVGQDEILLENARRDRIAHMVCGHRRYRLGDEQAENLNRYESWQDWLDTEVLEYNGGAENVFYLPLYLYDHSGLTMNTTGFSCSWDSGQVGWIYILKTDVEDLFYFENKDELETRAIEIMEKEVEIYNMYLTGQVYYYKLFQKNICECCGNVELGLIDKAFEIVAQSFDELKEILMNDAYIGDIFGNLINELKEVY